jgi:CubicO group peptidase (beta-lactamase class C family)
MKKIFPNVGISLLFTFLSLVAWSQPAKSYFKKAFEDSLGGRVVGYAFIISKNGKTISSGEYGYSIAPTKNTIAHKMTLNTRMHIASCAKPITSMGLLRLLQEKGIPVENNFWNLVRNKYPDVHEDVKKITVKDLLRHTTGYSFGYLDAPMVDSAAVLLRSPIPNPVGEKVIYSNINIALARVLIEILSGKGYVSYIKDNFLTPLGLLNLDTKITPEQSIYVYKEGGSLYTGGPYYANFDATAGPYGWFATPNEMDTFLNAIVQSKFLPLETTTEMFQKGLGWDTTSIEGKPVYRHDGFWAIMNNLGMRSSINIYPGNVTVVLFTNTNFKGDINTLIYNIMLEATKQQIIKY